MEISPGARVGGRYTLVRSLGRGGMGTVWEAVRDGGARVAAKLVLEELGENRQAIERFRREASAAAALNHPNIVEVLDFQHEPGEPPVLVMEYLDGVSLSHVLNVDRQLAVARAVRIASQALAALGSAHDAGIVHRDVKPANVMLISFPGMPEVVKVLDFGIAKLLETEAAVRLTRTGTVLGTPGFMAPEQMRADPIDGRADVYSVGVLLYSMLAGDLPYRGRNAAETLMAVLNGRARPVESIRPDVPPALAEVVRKSLAVAPADRYANAEEMIAALAPFRDEPHTAAAAAAVQVARASNPKPIAVPTTRQAPKRSLAPWLIGAGVLLLAFLGGAVAVGSQLGLGSPERDRSARPPPPAATPPATVGTPAEPDPAASPVPTASTAAAVAAHSARRTVRISFEPIVPTQAPEPVRDPTVVSPRPTKTYRRPPSGTRPPNNVQNGDDGWSSVTVVNPNRD